MNNMEISIVIIKNNAANFYKVTILEKMLSWGLVIHIPVLYSGTKFHM